MAGLGVGLDHNSREAGPQAGQSGLPFSLRDLPEACGIGRRDLLFDQCQELRLGLKEEPFGSRDPSYGGCRVKLTDPPAKLRVVNGLPGLAIGVGVRRDGRDALCPQASHNARRDSTLVHPQGELSLAISKKGHGAPRFAPVKKT